MDLTKLSLTARLLLAATSGALTLPAIRIDSALGPESYPPVFSWWIILHGLTFGVPDADLGQARAATWPDGSIVGIRAPLADHETPIMRTYVAVEDIAQAVKAAEERGALIAYPPTKQGDRGTFAIFIEGEVQHGLWQRL